MYLEAKEDLLDCICTKYSTILILMIDDTSLMMLFIWHEEDLSFIIDDVLNLYEISQQLT